MFTDRKPLESRRPWIILLCIIENSALYKLALNTHLLIESVNVNKFKFEESFIYFHGEKHI